MNPTIIVPVVVLASTPRNERFTYLIAPTVSDGQLATLLLPRSGG